MSRHGSGGGGELLILPDHVSLSSPAQGNQKHYLRIWAEVNEQHADELKKAWQEAKDVEELLPTWLDINKRIATEVHRQWRQAEVAHWRGTLVRRITILWAISAAGPLAALLAVAVGKRLLGGGAQGSPAAN